MLNKSTKNEFDEIYDISKEICELANIVLNQYSYTDRILHAIQYTTGTANHVFTGIVTKITQKKTTVTVDIANVFWNNIYVSSMLSINHSTDSFRIGGFYKFKAIITERDFPNTYDLTNFRQLDNLSPQFKQLPEPKSILKECPDMLKTGIFATDLYSEISKLDYTTAFAIFNKLRFNSISKYITMEIIPQDYFNTIIVGIYFRFKKEEKLWTNPIEKLINSEADLKQLLMLQMFVAWLEDVHDVKSPAQKYFSVIQFVLDNYGDGLCLGGISQRNNIFLDGLVKFDYHVLKNILGNMTFYSKNHLQEFSSWCIDNNLFK